MKIRLIDYNRGMVDAWKIAFAGVDDIEIHQNSAFAIPTECIVSPANSAGYMDGGFDATITNYLGPAVQANVQKRIREEYNGELLVGQAIYVSTENSLVPYCISAPTMRCPIFLGPTSVNAYLAARAIFILLKQPNLPFSSVTIPGLGTGVGKIPYENCAHQMRQAYDDFYLGKWKEPVSWWAAQVEHQKLFRFKANTYVDLQHHNSEDVVKNDLKENNSNVISPGDLSDMFPGSTIL